MARPDALRPLDLGPAVVQALIPQRPPFQMVDRLLGIAMEPRPTLRAARYISANEPLLAGHFPQVAVWPGALTLEALSQAAGCLVSIEHLAAALGLDDALAALGNLERRARLEPGFDVVAHERLEARLGDLRSGHLILAGAAQVRLVKPVLPGCRLDLRAVVARRLGESVHFQLEAEVDGQLVAEGTMTGARVAAG